MQSRKLTIITTISALLLVISAVSTLTPQSASAYEKNQATSQTSACGNEFMSINIGCQNTGSQIQGDENVAEITAQQTFPEVKLVQEKPSPLPKKPPLTTPPPIAGCVECFTKYLNAEQLTRWFEHYRIPIADGLPIPVPGACEYWTDDRPVPHSSSTGIPGDSVREQLDYLRLHMGEDIVVAQVYVNLLIDCLESVLGLTPCC